MLLKKGCPSLPVRAVNFQHEEVCSNIQRLLKYRITWLRTFYNKRARQKHQSKNISMKKQSSDLYFERVKCSILFIRVNNQVLIAIFNPFKYFHYLQPVVSLVQVAAIHRFKILGSETLLLSCAHLNFHSIAFYCILYISSLFQISCLSGHVVVILCMLVKPKEKTNPFISM